MATAVANLQVTHENLRVVHGRGAIGLFWDS